MPRPARPRATRVSAVLGALMMSLTLAACGLSSASKSSGDGSANRPAAPDLAQVTPLSDPRDWTGGVSAVAGDDKVRPVTAAPAQSLPVTLTDAQGTRVKVTDTSRTLALDMNGTLARTIFELGLGDQLAGRDTSTAFPEAADLPVVTQQGHDLNAEKILEADPTLIITDTSLGPWDVILQMRDAGIPVVVVDSDRSLDNVGSLTREIAAAMGAPEAGAALAERTQAEIDAVKKKIAAIAPSTEREKLRTAFLYVRGNAGVYYMFGKDSGADSLIDSLGLYDVASEIKWNGMKPITDEGLIKAQPEVVLMMTKGLESAGGIDGLKEKLPALAQTPAGQNDRIVDMSDSEILGYGPLTAKVLNALAVAVYAPDSVTESAR